MKKISGIQKLYIVVIVLYFVTFIFNIDLVKISLFNFLDLYLKIFKILILVFFVMFITNLFLHSNKAKKEFKASKGIKSWIFAILLWILIWWPPYALFPILKEFKTKWVSNSLLAVFLYNRNVKIPYIPISILYFGLSFTIILSLYIILFSIFNWIIIGKLVKEDMKN